MTLDVSRVQQAAATIRQNVGRVIVGDARAVDLLLVALLVEGHVLLEDVPGIGKTTLAKALARSLGASFHRIQFTPDLMPGDITGVSIFNPKTDQFDYRPGPLFANVMLADEINRATPRAQSALLEAMEERQVTVDGVTYPLPRPFIVLATQNPIEQEGTYPLPEAQLDRFLFMIKVDYPTDAEEELIMRQGTSDVQLSVSKILHGSDIIDLQKIVRRVPVAPVIFEYAKRITRMSRPNTPEAADFVNKWLTWGAGPRASMNLILAAKAHAILAGKSAVAASDVAAVASPILRHRLILNFAAQSEGITVEDVINRLLKSVGKSIAA